MKRVVCALALASVSYFAAAAPQTTQNVSIVSSPATVPVSVSSGTVDVGNSAGNPVNVAVVNGTAAGAVNVFAQPTVPANQTSTGTVPLYTNTGTSAVEFTSVGAYLEQNGCAVTPAWLWVEVTGSSGLLSAFAVPFVVTTTSSTPGTSASTLCGVASLPGKLVVGAGQSVQIMINTVVLPATVPGTFLAAMSGQTLQ